MLWGSFIRWLVYGICIAAMGYRCEAGMLVGENTLGWVCCLLVRGESFVGVVRFYFIGSMEVF